MPLKVEYPNNFIGEIALDYRVLKATKPQVFAINQICILCKQTVEKKELNNVDLACRAVESNLFNFTVGLNNIWY
jgi:hypothetical protein